MKWKVLFGFLVIGASGMTPAVSNASMICEVPKFVEPTEVFSLAQGATQTTASWENGDFSKIVEALKFADPNFSDGVVKVTFVFKEGECRGAVSNRALYQCNTGREGKIQIQLSSGKTLSVDGFVHVSTSTRTSEFLVADAQIRTETTFHGLMTFTFTTLWRQPLYAGVNSSPDLGWCQFK